ncbi:MAG: hypothetical protein IPN16_25925 [Gemmatimonadetes bacterium]|nr:hypothetical protein [Gemmatimonadota bacterium]
MGSYAAVTIGLVLGSTDKARLLSGIAIAFFLLALPCFFFVRERGHAVTARVFHIRDLVQSITTTVTTLRRGQRFPGLSRFLFGRLFYTDAINTVVTIMTLYAVDPASRTDRGRNTPRACRNWCSSGPSVAPWWGDSPGEGSSIASDPSAR